MRTGRRIEVIRPPLRQGAAAGLVVAAAALLAPAALAQEAYPSRTITIVVPFAAGSGGDIGARLVAKDMIDSMGQNVVVENRPGANGAIGAQQVARARPDGYTLMLGAATTNAANFAFYPGKLGYEPATFDIVGGVGTSPVSLYVAANAPWKNLAELIADAKKNPGRLACGSGNTVVQVVCEVFKRNAGVNLINVPYKGNPLALTDVVGGQVAMAFSDGSGAFALLDQKKIRVLAVAAARRTAYWPEVPTFAEQGVPDLEVTAWSAVFVPAGTPLSVQQKLNAAIRRAADMPEAVTTRQRTGAQALQFSLEEGRRFVASEIDRWARYVRETGVKAE